MIQFSKGFDPKETLTLLSSSKGMTWKSKETKQDIVFRSPILELVYPPTPAPGRNVEYSMCLRVHTSGDEKSLKQEQLFKELSENAEELAKEFMLDEKNGKRYAKNTFSSADDFKVTKFWYDNGQFYMRFRLSTSSHIFNVEETKKNGQTGKKVYDPIRDDVRRYLGAGSLITVDFRPDTFFYQKKNQLYPFSLNIEKILIWASNPNTNPDVNKRSTKKHGFLKGFSLDIPTGFKLPEEIEQQTEVPTTHVSTFNNENYSLSGVIDGAKGPVIYARYGDSFGPTYFKASNVEVQWDITPDPEYNSRSIVLPDTPANQSVLKMVREQFSKLVDTITENSEKILGDKYDRETVEDLISNPLYSKKDVGKEHARVSFKLPREEKSDKPLFQLYTLSSDEGDDGDDGDGELKTIVPIDMGEDCVAAEQYIGAGTVLKSVIFMIRPVIVNSQVYLSGRVEQLLVDPNQERVYTPALDAFCIPGYDDAEIENVAKSMAVPITADNISFTNFDDKKKSFTLLFEGKDGKTTQDGCLPPVTIPFDIGIVNDPDNNEFAYRNRYDPGDFMETIRAIDKKTVEYCAKISKDIFGSVKTEKFVTATINKGKLEKFAKKDTEKENPYCTMKAPVYEKGTGHNIAIKAFREIKPVDADGKTIIEPISLKHPEDLLQVFYSGVKGIPVVRIRGSLVDGRIILSTTVNQFLIVSSENAGNDIPFADDDDDMTTMAQTANDAFEKANEEEGEVEEKVEDKTPSVVEDKTPSVVEDKTPSVVEDKTHKVGSDNGEEVSEDDGEEVSEEEESDDE